jgi:hypothetical protein
MSDYSVNCSTEIAAGARRLIRRKRHCSRVRAHLNGRDDELLRVDPLQGRVGRFTDLMCPAPSRKPSLRCACTGHRTDAFLARFGRRLGRPVRPQTLSSLPATAANSANW